MSRFLTVNEASKFLGVTAVYLYQLVRKGEIPVVRVGSRAIRIKESDLLAWIEERSGKRQDSRGQV
jgi:excisionase family DNA binding protein